MEAGELLVSLPLVLVTLLAIPVVLLPVSVRAELLVSRLALPIFGGYVAEPTPKRRDQIRRMRAAFVGESHRVFQSQTLFMAAVAGVVGSVYGVYVGAAVLQSLAVDPAVIAGVLPERLAPLATRIAVAELSRLRLFGLLVVASAMLGAGLAAGTYWGRWTILDQRARARGVEIDATLPRTVAFVYALSRSGMPFQAVLRTLSRNEDVYGEAAKELGVAVRDMDAFGTDVLTALKETADRTPSENLEEFTENLASVLLSGQSVSAFLHEQYERFQEEVEAQQRQYLDLLSTFAEVYVTVLVAGPLFFITVLVVVGLVIQDTLVVIRLVTYLGIPLATFGFVVYVDSITEGLDVVSRSGTDGEEHADGDPRGRMASGPADPGNGGSDAPGVADGGTVRGRSPDPGTDADNWLRLAAYDRIGRYRRTLSDPVGLMLDRPVYSLLVTGPIGLVIVLLSLDASLGEADRLLVGGTAVSSASVLDLVEIVDGPVVLATIVALLGIAVTHEVEKRRLRAVEAEIPDFLDRMASINEAGATVVGSLNRLSDAELGPLGDEIRRVWRDIEWGATVGEALARMERRTSTPTVSRSVTLIRNAIAASGDISPVLRIAADEAKEIRRLERERRQEMLTYLVVIYVSFLVFLGIIVALTVSFIPAIEAAGAAGGAAGGSSGIGGGVAGVDPGILGGIGSVETGAYEVLFFHAAAIQGICSGLVAGQLGEGTVSDGVKHATVLLVLTYAVFAFL